MSAEVQMVAKMEVKMLPELRDLLGRVADAEDLPMNEYLVRLLARHLKRPDLATIPRKKLGRPRKEFAIR